MQHALHVPVQAVQTLPSEHIAAGRCEAAKICFAHGDSSFGDYLAASAETGPAAVERLIALSLTAKKWFIEVDEFDENERLLLNFGHSFGHALESCTDYLIAHGVAVGVGCLSAIAFSAADHPGLGELPRVAALRADLGRTLAEIDDLQSALDQVNRVDFFHYWQSDKKHNPAEYRPILLDNRGFLFRGTLPRDAATDDRIWMAFEAVRNDLAQTLAL